MALEWWDGFYQYPGVAGMAAGGWSFPSGGGSLVTGPDGDANWLRTQTFSGAVWARHAYQAPLNAGRFGAYLSPTSLDMWFVTFYDGVAGAAQCSIRGTADGRIQARLGDRNGPPIGAASPVCMASGVSKHIEAYALISDTVGVIQAWVENVLVLNLSNIDSKAHSSSTTFSAIEFGVAGNGEAFWKHVFGANPSGPHNAGQIGPRKVRRLALAADGSPMDYVADTGTDRYARINEQVLDTASYITSPDIGQKARFTKQNLAVTPASIAAVGIRRFALKSDAGACNDRSALVIGGTAYNADARALTTTGEHLLDVWEVDPSDGGAWTKARVDAAAVQVEHTL